MLINVAITMELSADPQQSIWHNGANQHCVYLYMLFKQSARVGNVWLVHRDGVREPAPNMLLHAQRQDVRPISQVLDQVDLLIEMNASISRQHMEVVRKRGGRCVTYRFGNDYVFAVESITFDKVAWTVNSERLQFDEVWTNPQHAHTCNAFFHAFYRAPVYVLPHIWSPYFIEQSLARNDKLKASFGYRNQGAAKRIAFFEPNINVVKSGLIPMLAANEFYVRRPDLVRHVFMTNTELKKENATFKHIALGLKMVQDRKATADQRAPFIEWAAQYTDIVVSHQWENGLNYLFYDALYGNYPLVHNSPFLRDVGYYYPDFDVFAAADAIEQAAVMHDQTLEAQAQRNAAFLGQLSPTWPANVQAHESRLQALFPS